MDFKEKFRFPPRPQPSAGLITGFKDALLAQVAEHGAVPPPDGRPIGIAGYEIRSLSSRGGMGEVWEAEDARGRQVAIKVMKRSIMTDEESRRRFLREGRAAASIDHPGIVDIHEVGVTTDGRPFIVMEYLVGQTLREFIGAHAPTSWVEARTIIVEIAEAIGAAHARGVVHRDIKPANIMRVGTGKNVSHKVIDFGLARSGNSHDNSTQLTQDGQLLGTPTYMSPEALHGLEIDLRSDIYALGCIAFELLEGTVPFSGGTFAELVLQHFASPLPRARLPEVPEELGDQVRALLSRTLSKHPKNRFSTMAEMVEAISTIKPGGSVITVYDEPPWLLSGAAPPVPVRPGGRARWGSLRRQSPLIVGGLMAGGLMALGYTELSRSSATNRSSTWMEADGYTAVESVTPPVHPGALVDVAAGVGLTCALADSGAIRCWGADSLGRLGRGGHGSHVGDNEYPVEASPLALPPDRTAVDLASGPDSRHVCVRWSNGRARCWGRNASGQLGLGTTDDWGDDPGETVAALPDLPFEGVEVIVTGHRNTCALLATGVAYCWGDGQHGIRGDGSTEPMGQDRALGEARRVAVGDRAIRGLALGRAHACGLLDDGTVRCWGANTHGQLGVKGWTASIGDGVGDGNGRGQRPDDESLAVDGLDGVQVRSVHAAADRSCVITKQHGVRCWGEDAHGLLGYSAEIELDCSRTSTDQRCDLDSPPMRDLDFGGARIVDISLGREHSCAVDDVGLVHCWGATAWGRLGDGSDGKLAPATPPTGEPVDLGDFDSYEGPDIAAQVSVANSHACARMEAGGVRCWGRGITGRLGYRSADNIGDDETPAQYYERVGYAAVFAFR